MPAEEKPLEYLVPPKHSVMGFISTVGAVTLFLAFLLFDYFNSNSVVSLKARLKSEPDNKDRARLVALTKTLPSIAFWVGISGAVFGLLWAAWSFRYRTIRFWSIAGCVTNGILLIWIVLK